MAKRTTAQEVKTPEERSEEKLTSLEKQVIQLAEQLQQMTAERDMWEDKAHDARATSLRLSDDKKLLEAQVKRLMEGRV